MAKKTKAEATYEPVAKGRDRCGTCRWFERPAACELVEGSISAGGWCKYHHDRGSPAFAIGRAYESNKRAAQRMRGA